MLCGNITNFTAVNVLKHIFSKQKRLRVFLCFISCRTQQKRKLFYDILVMLESNCVPKVLWFTLPITCIDYCISFLSDNIPKVSFHVSLIQIPQPGVFVACGCVCRVVYVPVASKPFSLPNNTSPEVIQLGECLNETLSVPVSGAEAEFLQLHRWKCFSSEHTNEEISH